MSKSRRLLKGLQSCFVALERERQAFLKRANDLEKEYGNNEFVALIRSKGEKLKKMEESVQAAMIEEVDRQPVWYEYLKYVNGIGPKTAGRILGGAIDPEYAEYPSSFHKYCCLHVVDGEAFSFSKGQKAACNGYYMDLMLYIVGNNLQRSNDFYYHRYRIHKQREIEKVRKMHESGDKDFEKQLDRSDSYSSVEEVIEGYAGKRAKRKMVKLFVSHLWEAWRTIEGLPTTKPYHVEHSEETNHYIPPKVQVDGETVDWREVY